MKFSITTWRAKIHMREDENDFEMHFANEGLARLAVEWAFTVQVERLVARTDVHNLELFPDYHGGRKLTWWKKVPKGYICMKDYFFCDQITFEREVIGEAA